MMFPFIGSGVLFGLYLAMKYLGKEYVNYLLTAYMLIISFFSVANSLIPIVKVVLFAPKKPKFLGSFTIPRIPYFLEEPVHVKYGYYEIIGAILGGAVVYFYAISKWWILNNVIGLCFCIQGIAFLSLGNYLNGCVLLGGLFIYDVFWVFGTDVMITVAKGLDAPIKLLFPKDIFAEVFEFSMLGLGDIVIPGIFIALLLRYDAFRFTKGKVQVPTGSWSKPYFTATFIGYILGLVATIVVMHTFKHGQPALLYLVPACVGFSFVTSVLLGDTKNLLKFSEQDDKKKEKKQA